MKAADKKVYEAVKERATDEEGNVYCENCGRNRHANLQMRHKIARSQGGATSTDNVFMYCLKCHFEIDHGYVIK